MSQSANLLVFPVNSSMLSCAKCMIKARGWPRGRQRSIPVPRKICYCPAVFGDWAQWDLTNAFFCSPKLLIYTFVVQISFVPWLKTEFEGISRIVFSFLKPLFIIKIICLLSSSDLCLVGRSVAWILIECSRISSLDHVTQINWPQLA